MPMPWQHITALLCTVSNLAAELQLQSSPWLAEALMQICIKVCWGQPDMEMQV